MMKCYFILHIYYYLLPIDILYFAQLKKTPKNEHLSHLTIISYHFSLVKNFKPYLLLKNIKSTTVGTLYIFKF